MSIFIPKVRYFIIDRSLLSSWFWKFQSMVLASSDLLGRSHNRWHDECRKACGRDHMIRETSRNHIEAELIPNLRN